MNAGLLVFILLLALSFLGIPIYIALGIGEDPLATLLLKNKNAEGGTVSVECNDGKISLRFSKKRKEALPAKNAALALQSTEQLL